MRSCSLWLSTCPDPISVLHTRHTLAPYCTPWSTAHRVVLHTVEPRTLAQNCTPCSDMRYHPLHSDERGRVVGGRLSQYRTGHRAIGVGGTVIRNYRSIAHTRRQYRTPHSKESVASIGHRIAYSLRQYRTPHSIYSTAVSDTA
eukprot:1670728-Rhodomonas_salina.1